MRRIAIALALLLAAPSLAQASPVEVREPAPVMTADTPLPPPCDPPTPRGPPQPGPPSPAPPCRPA